MSVDEREFERRLRDAKLAALAELAAGAGHEINNPVATIAGRARLLLESESDPNRRRSLATIASQALRIRDMIGDLMLFARPPQPVPVDCDLREIAREAVAAFAERAAEASVTLTVEDGSPINVLADPAQIVIAIASLVENALAAVDREGHIALELGSRANAATLNVLDDGRGFNDDDRQHAFDPFYSGRQAGRGLGFGLPKAWRIVTLAGGTIDVASRPGETCFTITLPRSS